MSSEKVARLADSAPSPISQPHTYRTASSGHTIPLQALCFSQESPFLPGPPDALSEAEGTSSSGKKHNRKATVWRTRSPGPEAAKGTLASATVSWIPFLFVRLTWPGLGWNYIYSAVSPLGQAPVREVRDVFIETSTCFHLKFPISFKLLKISDQNEITQQMGRRDKGGRNAVLESLALSSRVGTLGTQTKGASETSSGDKKLLGWPLPPGLPPPRVEQQKYQNMLQNNLPSSPCLLTDGRKESCGHHLPAETGRTLLIKVG